MNANELADELQKMFVGEEYDRLVHEIPDLLRQQQNEIEGLKMGFAGNGTSDSELAEVRAQANRWFLKIKEQQYEIEDLINAHRFVQNFAEEQHQRAVALEMRELTDEEILQFQDKVPYTLGSDLIDFARAILRKAQEK